MERVALSGASLSGAEWGLTDANTLPFLGPSHGASLGHPPSSHRPHMLTHLHTNSSLVHSPSFLYVVCHGWDLIQNSRTCCGL